VFGENGGGKAAQFFIAQGARIAGTVMAVMAARTAGVCEHIFYFQNAGQSPAGFSAR
jgi:hypothetical protein